MVIMGLFSGLFKRKNVTSEQNLSVERKAENEKQGILKNYVAQAKGFYEHMGFKVRERSEMDEQGNPYPILFMEIS